MPRRKTIPTTIDTAYFTGITPLWCGPSGRSIHNRYHDAVHALAEWAGPDWSDADQTDFFLIRDILIRSCESWGAHDWERDEEQIFRRKKEAELLPKLALAADEFSSTFSSSDFHMLKKFLANVLLTEFQIEPSRAITNGEAFSALERSFRRFAAAAKIPDRFGVRYGTVEYSHLPDRLPRKEVAIALSLADRITFFRKDGHSRGTLCCPHKPNLSPNLPWKSISLFASANVEQPDDEIDSSSVQTRVTSLARSVQWVYW